MTVNEELDKIQKHQYDEYIRTHRGTPGCGGALMIVALFLLAFALVL